MTAMFKLLGVLVACYVLQALHTGSIHAKKGVWGRTYVRDDDAFGYWSSVAAYALLAVALIFVF